MKDLQSAIGHVAVCSSGARIGRRKVPPQFGLIRPGRDAAGKALVGSPLFKHSFASTVIERLVKRAASGKVVAAPCANGQLLRKGTSIA
jgi:hypothetical protein